VEYGPFHRRESPTQTVDNARDQETSGELWGRAPRWGGRPQVKAFAGPLPEGKRGIEFMTDAEPDRNGVPSLPTWTGPRQGVTVRSDMAVINIQVTKSTQERER